MTSVARSWSALSSADPSGTVTIGSGDSRILVLAQTAEFSGAFSADCTIGGQSATGSYSVDQAVVTAHLTINAWWWNDAALEAMSGNSISYSDNATLSKQHFSYITLSSADQASPIATSTVYDSSTDSVDLTTTSDANDHIIAIVARESGNRDITDWDTLTEAWDDGSDFYRSAGADGSGGDSTTTITGDGANGNLLAVGLVVRDVSGAGIGALNAPVAQVSGAGAPDTNNVKPANRAVSGVGERKIVWQGGVELTAAAAGTNITGSDTPEVTIDAALVSRFSRASGSGERVISLSNSPQSPIVTSTGEGIRQVTGTGACSTVIPTTGNTVDFPAVWYVAKQVYI